MRKPPSSSPLKFVLLAGLVFLLGLGLRLFDLGDQTLGFYPLRQLQGAVIARGIYYSILPGADPALVKLAAGFWHAVPTQEPLIQQTIAAYAYRLLGYEALWVAGVFSTLCWMIAGGALFALAYRMADAAYRMASLAGRTDAAGAAKSAAAQVDAAQMEAQPQSGIQPVAFFSALLALAYFMVLPFSVYTSRSFQPDPQMVMWILLGTYALYRWSESQAWKWAVMAGLFSGLAVLVKAFAVYPVGVLMLVMVLYTLGERRLKRLPQTAWRILRNPQVWAMAALTLGPVALFYATKEDRAASYFTAWTLSMAGMLLNPGFYLRWLNLVQSLLHPLALLAGLAGFILARGRNRALLFALLLGYFIYCFTLPYQTATHSYYHLQLVPLASLAMTPALQAGIAWLQKRTLAWRVGFALLALAGIAYASWLALAPMLRDDYRTEPAFWQALAQQIPNDGKTIAVTQDYGFRLIYYGWRKLNLWPNASNLEVRQLRGNSQEFERLFRNQTKGFQYFLVTDFEELGEQPALAEYLEAGFPVYKAGDGWVIYQME